MKRRAFVVAAAVALGCAALVSVPASASSGSRARVAVADRKIFHAEASALGGAQQSLLVAPKAPLATTCYTYKYGDASHDTKSGFDVVAYSMAYDCVHHAWRISATASGSVASPSIYLVQVLFDADGDHTDGCGGFERYVATAWIAAQHKLLAGYGTEDSNCVPHFQRSLTVDRTSSRTIAVNFPDTDVHRDFAWWGFTLTRAPTSLSDYDQFPNGTSVDRAISTSTTAFTAGGAPSLTASYRTPIATADFNGDGYSDMLLYAPGSASDQFLMGGPSGFSSKPVTINSTFTQIVGGDFDGDGYGDLEFYAAGTGADFFWFGSASGKFTRVDKPINGTYQLVPGDFNCDGTTDLLLARSGGGTDTIWFVHSDRTITSGSVTLGPGHVNTGDFNGDGCADVLTWQAGAGADSMRLGSIFGFGAPVSESINGSYAMARTGDFNGDGNTDVLFFSPDTAPDALVYGKTTGSYLQGGAPIVINERYNDAVVGDFNHDDVDDVLFYAAGAIPERLWRGPALFPMTLPFQNLADFQVEPSTSRLFLSGTGGTSALVVAAANGRPLQTIPLAGAGAIAFDGNVVYVSMQGSATLARFDLATLTRLSDVDISATGDAQSLAVTNGKLWWSASGGFGSYDPGTDMVSAFAEPAAIGALSASAAAPGKVLSVIRGSSPGQTTLWDMSSGTPAVVGTTGFSQSGGNCSRSVFSLDGTKVLTACGYPYDIDEWDAATMTETGHTYDTGPYPDDVAVTSARGGLVVGQITGKLWIYPASSYSPTATVPFASGSVVPRSLQLSTDAKTAYCVENTVNGLVVVHTALP
jgi:hypothetical protein